ncbi:Scr1 family TA system antitoxin-like transcriptional regulator [Plantactinospora alkalitolerans]|uniref:Scr1 family TA system antitoxin-like transcriptional regulator n=1 Tax=Plantactinospora alkalitolerans TaxID=2789879 RepID=UPI00389AA401
MGRRAMLHRRLPLRVDVILAHEALTALVGTPALTAEQVRHLGLDLNRLSRGPGNVGVDRQTEIRQRNSQGLTQDSSIDLIRVSVTLLPAGDHGPQRPDVGWLQPVGPRDTVMFVGQPELSPAAL